MNAIESNFKINVTNRGAYTSPPTTATTTTTTTTSTSATNPTSNGREYIDGQIPTLNHPKITTTTKIQVHGYAWGTETFYTTADFGKPADPQPALRSFDRVIIADCLWMPAQHENLVKTVLSYLKPTLEAERRERENGNGEREESEGVVPCALVVAGFHTGRAIVRDFVEIATGSVMGDGDAGGNEKKESSSLRLEDGGDSEVRGRLRAAEIFEVDVDGRRRSWQPQRPSETKEQSKRWCMCAILVRR